MIILATAYAIACFFIVSEACASYDAGEDWWITALFCATAVLLALSAIVCIGFQYV